MDKKFFVSIASTVAVAMLSACGSQDVPDQTPAGPDYSTYTDMEKNMEPNGSELQAVPIGVASLSQAEGVKLKGTLSNKFETDNGRPVYVLDEDYYKIDLMNGEVISITASNASNISSPFSIKFYGPCHRPTMGCTEKETEVVNPVTFKETIKGGDFQGSDTYETRNTFYIKISNSIKDSEGYYIYSSVSYAINIKLGQ